MASAAAGVLLVTLDLGDPVKVIRAITTPITMTAAAVAIQTHGHFRLRTSGSASGPGAGRAGRHDQGRVRSSGWPMRSADPVALTGGSDSGRGATDGRAAWLSNPPGPGHLHCGRQPGLVHFLDRHSSHGPAGVAFD